MSVNEKMTAIADPIRSLIKETEPLTLDDMASSAEQLVAANADLEKVLYGTDFGGKSQYDEFWDNYQDYGNRTDYDMAFGSVGWTDATFKPKYKIKPVESAHRMFQDSLMTGDLTQCGVEVDFSECQQMQMTFYNTKFKKLGVINALSTTTLNSAFSYSTELETIEKLIVKDDGSVNIHTNTFQSCVSLQNISIEGKIGKSGKRPCRK